MSDIFLKLLRSNRVTPEEKTALGEQLKQLADDLQSNRVPDATRIQNTIAALYIYATASQEQKQEVIAFAQWFQAPEEDANWSEGLREIVSRCFGDVQLNRIEEMLVRINNQKSLTNVNNPEALISRIDHPDLRGLYNNTVDELNIDFSVSILPFDLEVLDPRIVTVKPGKANEMHKHAHETVFIFIKGKGKVIVDQYQNEVAPGDFACIPRWCNHQTVNIGDEDLVFLAVADFGLTGKSFMGNYLKTARMKSK